MSTIEDYLAHARGYAADFPHGDLKVSPARRTAVVTCMDSRMDIFGLLGLAVGDAHVIRNAGGILTTDVLRSLAISQRRLGTRTIVIIHHTDCGMLGLDDPAFRAEITAEGGVAPEWSEESSGDSARDVRRALATARETPILPFRDEVRGFVYDVRDGSLREVT